MFLRLIYYFPTKLDFKSCWKFDIQKKRHRAEYTKSLIQTEDPFQFYAKILLFQCLWEKLKMLIYE